MRIHCQFLIFIALAVGLFSSCTNDNTGDCGKIYKLNRKDVIDVNRDNKNYTDLYIELKGCDGDCFSQYTFCMDIDSIIKTAYHYRDTAATKYPVAAIYFLKDMKGAELSDHLGGTYDLFQATQLYILFNENTINTSEKPTIRCIGIRQKEKMLDIDFRQLKLDRIKFE